MPRLLLYKPGCPAKLACLQNSLTNCRHVGQNVSACQNQRVKQAELIVDTQRAFILQ